MKRWLAGVLIQILLCVWLVAPQQAVAMMFSAGKIVNYSSAYDPYYSSVTSLLHFNGNITDNKSNTWTAFGSAATGTPAYFGSAALVLASANSKYLTSNTTPANFEFGTGDFTMEGFIYPTVVTGANRIFTFSDTISSAGSFLSFSAYISSSKLIVTMTTDGNTANTLTGTTTLATSTWYYFKWYRLAGATTLCVNTTVDASAASSQNGSFYAPTFPVMRIGELDATAPQYFSGNIDEVRITKGVARIGCVIPTLEFKNQ
jgi:hypothetical protein